MGILDDAIREHLDLKRRLGAADSEIQRLEDEAFGPPTRPGEPDFPETGEAAELSGAEEALPEPDEPAAAEPAAEPDDAPQPTFFDHSEDEPEAEPPSPEAPGEPALEIDDPASHLEVLSEPAGAPVGEPPIESLDTVEHHFEGAIEDTGDVEVVEADSVEAPPETGEEPPPAGEEAAAAEGEDEDVLEETPEFLRDQPEDDELWFEQGEPKDFDF
jgi:hypothetical protein